MWKSVNKVNLTSDFYSISNLLGIESFLRRIKKTDIEPDGLLTNNPSFRHPFIQLRLFKITEAVCNKH